MKTKKIYILLLFVTLLPSYKLYSQNTIKIIDPSGTHYIKSSGIHYLGSYPADFSVDLQCIYEKSGGGIYLEFEISNNTDLYAQFSRTTKYLFIDNSSMGKPSTDCIDKSTETYKRIIFKDIGPGKHKLLFYGPAVGEEIYVSLQGRTNYNPDLEWPSNSSGGILPEPSPLSDPAAITFSNHMNYMATLTPLKETSSLEYKNGKISNYKESNAQVEIQYFDGLGRPVQQIQYRHSPEHKDVITIQEYKDLDLANKVWLPTPFTSNGTCFQEEAIKEKAASVNDDEYPYSFTSYESSERKRILSEYGPGKEWYVNRKALKKEYFLNTGKLGNTLTASDKLVCARYKTTDDTKSILITRTDNYEANELYVTCISDEDGKTTYEFKNKRDQVLLIRQINEGQLHDTYYIYDSYGNLRVVLSPEASARLITSATGWKESDEVLRKYAYFYKYDERNRCIEKKIPGIDPIYMVYDKSDRLIFTQDGNQRANNQWSFSIPDNLGRVALTGTCGKTINLLLISNDNIKSRVIRAEYIGKNGLYNGYNIKLGSASVSEKAWKVLCTNYYDTNNFLELLPAKDQEELSYTQKNGYGTRYGNSKGLLTGTRICQLNDLNKSTITAYYYDYYGNEVQILANNHLNGYEKKYYKRTFTGKAEQYLHEHMPLGKDKITEHYKYEYDHAERLLKSIYTLNNESPITLSENSYDELGQVKAKKLHGGKEEIKYDYNVRNWLTNISSKNFKETLKYLPYYNGNIYGTYFNYCIWEGTKNSTSSTYYEYTYDNLNRITAAKYGEAIGYLSPSTAFKVEISKYDKNGNIGRILRNGPYKPYPSLMITPFIVGGEEADPDGFHGRIDDLTFQYNGNQLINVQENAPYDPVYNDVMHFMDISVSGDIYKYDRNGNMQMDKNKSIQSIYYNILNLPELIEFSETILGLTSESNYIEYTYDADGTKKNIAYNKITWRGTGLANLYPIATIDYCDNIIYKDGKLDKILTPEGYVDKNNNGKFVYHYYLKDHQGNNRVVIDQNGTIEQANGYYPFGALFGSSKNNSDQSLKYNGKELDRMFALDLYDYHRRMYNPVIARFISIDPLCEKYYSISPYVYCMNNPVKYIDPDGRSPYYDLSGRFLGTDEEGFSGQILIASEDVYNYNVRNGVTSLETSLIQDLDLSAQALSGIYTHILEEAGFSLDMLEGNAIAVKGKRDTFNKPSMSNEFLRTSFFKEEGTVFKISLTDDISSRTLLNTVENAINAIGDHEYTGHGILKKRDREKNHHEAYEYQMSQPSYKKSTETYKKFIERAYQLYLDKENIKK